MKNGQSLTFWLLGIIASIAMGAIILLWNDINGDIARIETDISLIKLEYSRIAVIEAKLSALVETLK